MLPWPGPGGCVVGEQASARQLNRQLAAGLPPGVRLFDPLEVLCPKECRNYTISPLLRDTDHLSREGARKLLPAFLRVLGMGSP